MEKHPPFIVSHGEDRGSAAHEVTTASNRTDAIRSAEEKANELEMSFAVYQRIQTIEPRSKVVEKERFWIVFSPEGITPPKKEHDSEQEANTAAEAMANMHPKQTFFVMEARRGFKVNSVAEIKLVDKARTYPKIHGAG
jgi:hypothetical protein